MMFSRDDNVFYTGGTKYIYIILLVDYITMSKCLLLYPDHEVNDEVNDEVDDKVDDEVNRSMMGSRMMLLMLMMMMMMMMMIA